VFDGGLYRIHLDVEEEAEMTPNFNPAIHYMDQTAASIEGIRPDSAAHRVGRKLRYGSGTRREEGPANHSMEGGRKS
jgi:hypothetical protein